MSEQSDRATIHSKWIGIIGVLVTLVLGLPAGIAGWFPSNKAATAKPPSAAPQTNSAPTRLGQESKASMDQRSARDTLNTAATTAPSTTAATTTELPPLQSRHQITLDETNAKSIWSTSVYSYVEGGGGGGPGGGLADDRLRVGGWGDTYVSLLKFNLPDHRSARRARLVFQIKSDDARSRPTAMRVRLITQPWSWVSGDRLWWRDLPASRALSLVDAPQSVGSPYAIDVTEAYNGWASGRLDNEGLMLEPIATDNKFSTFYSTRAPEELRPRLVLEY